MKYAKYIILSITAILAVTIFTNSKIKNTKNTDKSVKTDTQTVYDFSASTLNINRASRESETPMGEEGTWTIFVYMCGSNLESDYGNASADLAEMTASSADENVRFVVETGGANEWKNGVSSDKLQRYEICNNEMTLIESQDYSSMSESDTLSDFLKWGVENYPAANMGLVFWDHGGGCIYGVCSDEKSDASDTLLLREIDAALYNVYDLMTEPFEFIGFDACLMSTVEGAALFGTHANYMIASSESEPGDGWDYEAIGDYLAENPFANGEELGKTVCDSYYEHYITEAVSAGSSRSELITAVQTTMSVVDLSKMDDIMNGFDLVCKDIYELESNTDFLTFWAYAYKNSDYFGSKRAYNSADLSDVITCVANYSDYADDLNKLIDEAVVYKKNGALHSDSCGLTVFFPFDFLNLNSTTLSIYEDISLNEYYLGIVLKMYYSYLEEILEILQTYYDYDTIMNSFSNDWSESVYTSNESDFSYDYEPNDTWSFADDITADNESTAIKFSKEPAITDGEYCFTLTEDSIAYVGNIYSSVYKWDDENQILWDLGDRGDVGTDYSTGEVTDNFDGYWFSLPDGQLLSASLVNYSNTEEIYSSPVKIGDREMNLIFVYDKESKQASIAYICENTGENGTAARGESLSNGDVITPIYPVYMADGEDYNVYGKEYTFDGNQALTFSLLPDSEYWYAFYIDDIFGSHYRTDFVKFNIENESEDFTYVEEEHRWVEADCTNPKHCVLCGKTEGEALGHDWEEATCTTSKTCSRCGKTDGEKLGHTWKEATFSSPKTCTVCGETDGEAISVPIGDCGDYLVTDIDYDGEDELVEVTQEYKMDGYHFYWNVYENETVHKNFSHYTSGEGGVLFTLVYNNSTKETELWELEEQYDGNIILWCGENVQYQLEKYILTDEGVIAKADSYHYYTVFDGNYDEITKKEVKEYIDNATIIYVFSRLIFDYESDSSFFENPVSVNTAKDMIREYMFS